MREYVCNNAAEYDYKKYECWHSIPHRAEQGCTKEDVCTQSKDLVKCVRVKGSK